jgi:hypothetical protein
MSFIRFLSKLLFFIIVFSAAVADVHAQGKNHNWLIGYDVTLFDTNVTSTKARMLIDSSSIVIASESRKMAFRGCQGNISDENGNLLIVSNGCWIANATGDTMLSGAGLNTGFYSSLGWCSNITGLPLPHGNVVLPLPGNTNKFILFHQIPTGLFYSVIDMSLDGGLGGVVQKNIPVIQDSLASGLAACKHANGRDWWIVVLKDNSNEIYKVLLTPDTINSVNIENLDMPATYYVNACQPTFSPDGSKFAYSFGYGGPNGWHDARILTFDRCTGTFDSLMYVPPSGGVGLGLAFSSSSNYLYHSSFNKIYQVDLSNFSQDTVAVNDGYYSPYPPLQTDFWYMYLAANGKIYISSGSSVIDMHVINSPDSAGLACDVQQHSLHTPCFFVRSNVLHPNYYLGPVNGSICDTLALSVKDIDYDFHFSVSPNPNNGSFKISYLLPQNSAGRIEVMDVQGKIVFQMQLPPWSTMQQITLPQNISEGIYTCAVISNGEKVYRKIAIVKP